jgi:hypothetical protein
MAVIRTCLKGRDTLYQTIVTEAEFIDPGCFRAFFFRNCVMSKGVSFFVVDIEDRSFERVNICCLVISLNIELLGESCFGLAKIQIFATEAASHLRYFESDSFAFVKNLSVLFIPGDWTLSLSSSRQTCPPLDIKSFLLRSRANFRSSAISARMFLGSLSLILVYIPSSVTILRRSCFNECHSLSTLTFESNSKLYRIEAEAFQGCSSLKSICIPASVQMIDGSAFIDSGISKITIAEGNSYFSVRDDFLLDFEGIAVLRYFGQSSDVRILSHIQTLCSRCFIFCQSLYTLRFE